MIVKSLNEYKMQMGHLNFFINYKTKTQSMQDTWRIEKDK